MFATKHLSFLGLSLALALAQSIFVTNVRAQAGVRGNPALIQSKFGTMGNFEVVAPHLGGGLAHYWREDIEPFTWHGPTVFGTSVGLVNAVTLIQSNYSSGGDLGNLDVVTEIPFFICGVEDGQMGEDGFGADGGCGGRLAHFWREDIAPFTWHDPLFIEPGSF